MKALLHVSLLWAALVSIVVAEHAGVPQHVVENCQDGICDLALPEFVFKQASPTTTDDISGKDNAEENVPRASHAEELTLEDFSEIFDLDADLAVPENNSQSATTNTTEDCRFMSFEEWKKQKQIENENEKSNAEQHQDQEPVAEAPTNATVDALPIEEQGKTYKDKFNYASVDCAATVVLTNKDARGALAILTEHKDSYLLNRCSSSSQFVVIELCQDILVSSVVLGNYELFSSMFRKVKFAVSDRFPVTNGWKELGEFEAKNIRDVQIFQIENPLIWARYLRIEVLSHYGNEFYCPISVVRVHGTTMMEEFKTLDVLLVTTSASPETVVPETVANKTEIDDEECRVRLPYLGLNEFLKLVDYCEVPQNDTLSKSAETASVITTQESIFQNIVKRLSRLESNASLSLLYVEEQSKILSDAFANLEKRHLTRVSAALAKLSNSVAHQMGQIDKTMANLEEEVHRITQITADEHSSRVTSLIRELNIQRRIVILDTFLVVTVLAYLVITREFSTVDVHSGESEKPRRRQRQAPRRKLFRRR